MRIQQLMLLVYLAAMTSASLRAQYTAATRHAAATPRVERLASGLQGASGSTVGPDGALYVTEGTLGRISRVDPRTGQITTFATGLPPRVIPLGGAIDVAFIGRQAYALVTLVAEDVGGQDKVGIYRVDGPNHRLVADLGAFSVAHPPAGHVDVPSGLQYALDVYHGGFVVTDGHHNRVLRARRDGEVSELIAFDNVVPTGLAVNGNVVLIGLAGPTPHLPEDGKIVAFWPPWPFALEIAAGAPLVVDVEFGRGRRLYALSQGRFPEGGNPADPALPHTGALLRVRHDGTFDEVVGELNQPTSVEIIGDTAYVVTLPGEIFKIDLDRHHR